ncbi:YeiH family protein [Muricoccus radiodurans]|uniref:YeiH family protein n=1 Tax=Muricoccus radiodurans TaxID=2231721 RepID=UPI003CF9B87A
MASTAGAARPSRLEFWRLALPGLAVSFAIAALAIGVRNATGLAALNPVVVALVAGIGLRAALGLPGVIKPGIAAAVRPVLRFAIVLLGLQVTLGALLSLGGGALVVAMAVVGTTLPFTIWLGRRMGVEPALATLIGTGTAICGASAIVAANQVARGRDGDVAYALAVITLCGTAAMLLWPLLAAPLGLDARAYGLWAGASVHEVVQAVGAAAAGGDEATRAGTVMKLARVFLLAPAVLALGAWMARSGGSAGEAKVAVPWFAFGFLGMVVLGSAGLVPDAAVSLSRAVVPILMAASVAALGLSTDLKDLRLRGAAPLVLGVASSLFIAAVAYAGVRLIG